ncbi:serine/threonine protein kinase [Virgibacillus subterraneus]|uniref:Serine/threonine protein kinase n=2 Tax=Virgibacillus TaxID=84406 RepID=A0A1H0XN09_9BACI|nr:MULTISPECIES: protein kinase family protein [Virgibacillus]SDQ04191.1 serine/threonine protein kinase [Virgibacillus salinus]SEQ98385.1 serine/threonine protein kinase [Virgibacillus subterraneus]
MKMNQAWKKHGIDIKPGTIISGKWHKHRYVIKKKLGQGAVGSVYLCDRNGKQVALKISDKSTSMTMEVNVLKSLKKVQGNRLGPCLLDVDDWEFAQNTKYAFYVMEYLHGETLSSFINRNGDEWIGVFMLQLLDDLERLHQAGWVFGDFKTENLIVLSSPPKVRWIDVGGTTQIGRAIKEYTEFYDRGYWGFGSRRAEPSYDLFAFVMVFLNIYYPKRFDKGSQPKSTLFKRLDDVKQLRMYRNCLKDALLGKYKTSGQMKNEITKTLQAIKSSRKSKRRAGKSVSKGTSFVEAGGIFLIALFYYLSSILLL